MYCLRSVVPNVDYLEGYQWSGFWGGAVYGFVTLMFFSDCCMIGFFFFYFLTVCFSTLKKYIYKNNKKTLIVWISFHNSLCDVLVHFVYAKMSHFGYTIFTNLKFCSFHLRILAFLHFVRYCLLCFGRLVNCGDCWLVLCSGSTHYMFHNLYIC